MMSCTPQRRMDVCGWGRAAILHHWTRWDSLLLSTTLGLSYSHSVSSGELGGVFRLLCSVVQYVVLWCYFKDAVGLEVMAGTQRQAQLFITHISWTMNLPFKFGPEFSWW